MGIGMEMQSIYTEINVGASRKTKLIVEILAETEKVEWDWVIEAHTINFAAVFQAVGSSEPIFLQRHEQHSSDMGPGEGSLEVTGPGTLTLASVSSGARSSCVASNQRTCK